MKNYTVYIKHVHTKIQRIIKFNNVLKMLHYFIV